MLKDTCKVKAVKVSFVSSLYLRENQEKEIASTLSFSLKVSPWEIKTNLANSPNKDRIS